MVFLSILFILLSALLGLVAYWYLNTRLKNAPPGPIGFPYLGYAPFLSSDPFIDFDKLGKKYKSNIIGLYLGPLFTVVLNDWDAVRATILDQEAIFTGRPKNQFVTDFHAKADDGEIRSIIALEGPKLKFHQNFIHNSLVELGVNTPKMEKLILEEIDYLITAIQEENGNSFNFFKMTNPTTSSIVARYAFGSRWSPRSEEYKELMKGTDEEFQLLAGSPIQVMPWTRFIPGSLKNKWEMTKAVQKRHHALIRAALKLNKETYEEGKIRNFADVFIRQMKGEETLDRSSFQNEEDFIATTTTFFQAGGEATCAALEWGMLFLLLKPDVQKRIHEEIDAKIGRDRPILFSDKESLPYTTGAVFECFRLGGNSALGVPRSNVTETEVLGYQIPKRSMVLINMWSAHRNPKDWKYPEEFNPENWIDDSGQFQIPDCFLSFSLGIRKCPGHELAKILVFMVFANLLQKFSFVNPLGQILPEVEEYIPGITARPKPFNVRAVSRSKIS